MTQTGNFTKQEGDAYRAAYDTMSFAEKQHAVDAVLQRMFQIVDLPRFLLSCLHEAELPLDFKVIEVGGYDGTHALSVLQRYPEAYWLNYDISYMAGQLIRPELRNYRYTVNVLRQPFHLTPLPTCDVFYSSKTLEHMRLSEVLQTLEACKTARYQVHIIDHWWKDDTHVLEKGSHRRILKHLHQLGYVDQFVKKHPVQSYIFCELKS